jgi:hypothetical protein
MTFPEAFFYSVLAICLTILAVWWIWVVLQPNEDDRPR